MISAAYSEAQTLLKIDNVHLSFNGNPVLRGIDAEVHRINRADGVTTGQIVGILGPSGMGKCLAKGTPVLMYDGSIKKVEEISIGDRIMGPDSSARTVLSLGSGRDEMYRISPIKGESFTVNGPHILALHLHKSHRSKSKKVEISVTDYLKQSKTFKSRAVLYRTGVDFPEKQVPLNPYFLGLWLGDGDNDSPTITNQDSEIIDWIKKFAESSGASLSEYISGSCPRFRVHNNWDREGSVLGALKALNVMRNKHIPFNYKTNSNEIRLKILAGIIDSDGSLESGCYTVTLKDYKLVVDICFLARSLGLAANLSPVTKYSQNDTPGVYYKIVISGEISKIPVLVKRKSASKRKQIKNVLHTGFKVIPVGIGDYYGFQIDGDGLFLLGDFTVTHNTQLFNIIAGLNQPTSGQVSICHGDNYHPVEAGQVGVVPQDYPLFDHRTVQSNLIVAARKIDKKFDVAKQKVNDYLKAFDLYDRMHLYPAQLSGGQRQRIAIIQQILCSEHYLLMDEPFSGLDPNMVELTERLIVEIAKRDGLNTIIIVSHDIPAIASVADHIWMLGREKAADGSMIPGARIVEKYNLIDEGLAWQPGINDSMELMQFVRKVRQRFRDL